MVNQFESHIDDITLKLASTLKKKNKDYGDSYFRSIEKYGETVTLIRLSDKFNRYENIIMSGEPVMVAEEKVEETLLDLMGYCALELERRMRKHGG